MTKNDLIEFLKNNLTINLSTDTVTVDRCYGDYESVTKLTI